MDVSRHARDASVVYLARLKADAFESGSDDVRFRRVLTDAGDQTASIRTPVGRKQTGQGWHEIDTAGVLHRCCYRF